MQKQTFSKILEPLFISLGLSEKEARIYRIILEIGQGKAGTVSTKSGLKRGITYATLYNLEKQGLVSQVVIKSKTHFRAEDPTKLLDLVDKKKDELKTLENSLKDIVPKLKSQYKLAVGKPTIRFFEGEEGIKAVFEDIYAPKKEPVYGCVDLEKADEAFPSFVLEKLIPKRVKNKLVAKALVADSPQAREIAKHDKEQLRETILIDKKKYPVPAEIDVYEDKIAMLSFKKGEFIGILIENKDLAESLKSIFKVAFKQGQPRRKL